MQKIFFTSLMYDCKNIFPKLYIKLCDICYVMEDGAVVWIGLVWLPHVLVIQQTCQHVFMKAVFISKN